MYLREAIMNWYFIHKEIRGMLSVIQFRIFVF
jgi:hypothetical protein